MKPVQNHPAAHGMQERDMKVLEGLVAQTVGRGATGFPTVFRHRRRARRVGAHALCRLIGSAALLFVLVASAAAQQPAPAAAVPVGTVAAARKPIAKTADFVGRIQAVESVDVNARVTGYLEE